MEIKSVAFTAVEFFRKLILTNQLKESGQKLDESQLASLLNINRSPLIEAFRLLEKENLIFTIPRKGSFVFEMSAKDFTELYEIRKMGQSGFLNAFIGCK